jgi:uncharacterized membrane protein YfcA
VSLDLINPFAGLSPLALGVMALGLFFAALARGYSGFGFSAVLVSSWSLVTDPARAIAVALMLEVAASIVQAVSVWKEIPWRRVAILLAGALIGSPLGVYFLATLPLDVMRLVVSLFVLVSASLMLLGWKLRKKASEWGTGAVGDSIANGIDGFFRKPVGTADRFGDDCIDDTETQQILRGDLHGGCRILRATGVTPQNRCGGFRRGDRID